jgi:Fe-S cluster assembly protein SufD
LYYAETRGIPAEDARDMLVAGFFEPVLDRIPLETVRKRVRLAIQEKSTTMEEKPASDADKGGKPDHSGVTV